MFLNKVLDVVHKPIEKIYNSSAILQNLDSVIFIFIISTFIFSTFLSSDFVGYLAFTTFLLTTVRVIATPKDTFSCKKFELFLLAYFIICIISVGGSTLLSYSLKGFFKTFIYLSFYLSVVHHIKYNKKNILWILLCIACCVSFESIIGLSQNFIKVDEISGWQDTSRLNPEEIMTRVYGTLQPLNPNLLGGYLVVGLPSLFGLSAYYFSEKKYNIGLISLILILLSILTLFLTGCRGAYLSFFLMCILLFLVSFKFFWKNYKKIYFSVIVAIFSLGISLICAISSLRARVLSIFAMRSDSSNSFRFNVYQSSLQMFKDNWVLGIGMGNQNFREIYGLYMRTGFDALSAYNIYLETAVESGIFALITFLIFLILLLRDGILFIIKSQDSQRIIFASTAIISICGVMLHGMVDTVFFRPQIQIIFWTMIAILSNQIYESTK